MRIQKGRNRGTFDGTFEGTFDGTFAVGPFTEFQ